MKFLSLLHRFSITFIFALLVILPLSSPSQSTSRPSFFPSSFSVLTFSCGPASNSIQISEKTTKCRTEVAMAVAVVEEVEDTQMGMMTIQATILVEIQEVETILQPIPTGMNIQGLEVAV